MCENFKDQFHQETGQDQVNNQDTTHESLQNTNQDQNVDQNQHSTQEQTLEQIFKDKNVGISTLNLIINNNPAKEETSIWEGSIVGRIFNDLGNSLPLSNKRIDVFFASTAGYPVATLYSDETGAYKITQLPPGFYTLRVYCEDHSFNPTDIVNVKVMPNVPTTRDILVDAPAYSQRKVHF